MSDFSGKRKLSINLSLFIGLSETFSSSDHHHTSKSPNSNKSQRIFEGGVVGLGIVAAMDEMSDTHDSILSNKLSISPKSQPIPIVFSKPLPKLREPTLEKDEMELSESYTCVISHLGDTNSVKKIEYFHGEPGGMNGNLWVSSGVFFTSPPKYSEAESLFHAPDFLSTCYLCKKKLNGLDIFMYRGEKAFCSAECRCRQIKKDEQKHRRENGSVKPFDYSVSPCSAPRFIVAGVAAA